MHSLPVPVISIGNLTVGGTGKTPFTIYIVDRLKKFGLKPAVLTRGYKRKRRGYLIMHGNPREVNVLEAGDEPCLIFREFGGEVPVGIGRERERVAKLIMERFPVDIFILDDGFQYRKLHQDLRILLFDAKSLQKSRYLLPAGEWREPLGAHRRAHILVINWKFTHEGKLSICFKRPTFMMRYRNICFVDVQQKEYPLDTIQGKNILAFAGIAKPEGFIDSLKVLKPKRLTFLRFPDHHWYTDCDVNSIREKAEKIKAEFVVTTVKDLIKINTPPFNLLALKIGVELGDEEGFWAALQQLLPLQPLETPEG